VAGGEADVDDLQGKFDKASRHFGDLVKQVTDDQWKAPTPCSDWDVRALVNHLVYEARWAVPLLAGATIEDVGDRFDGDLLGDDPKATFEEARTAAAGAVEAPGAMDTTVHLSFGDTPGAGYVMQLTGDFVVHSWDLARGIGADDSLDPELVEWVYAETLPQAEMLAGSGMFDPPVDVPEDADAQTKMLALFGRKR
jgi:uncharacterized protein (TIGR03086 family)